MIISQKQPQNKGNRSQKVMLWLASNWISGFIVISLKINAKPEKTRL
jgi:hypothetical protein